MRLDITSAAEQELDEAFEWYQRQYAGLEQQFMAEFRAAVRRINARPELYRAIQPGIRRGLLHRFPYSLFYEVDTDVLRILAVAHQHRRPLYWVDNPSA